MPQTVLLFISIFFDNNSYCDNNAADNYNSGYYKFYHGTDIRQAVSSDNLKNKKQNRTQNHTDSNYRCPDLSSFVLHFYYLLDCIMFKIT